MMRNGRVCLECRGGRHYRAGIHGCINLPMALKLFCSSRGIIHDPYRDVKLFISPGRFLIKTIDQWGFKGNLDHLHHFLEPADYLSSYDDSGYVLFFGRLTAIKGIDTLLAAARDLPFPLRLAGAGEREGEIRKVIAREGMEHVSLTGYLQGNDLREAIRNARFVVVPSECFENSPYSVMEAFAMGKPVVGSDRGGITELLGDNERGLLFPAGDAEKLRECMLLLWNDRERGRKLGISARAYAEKHFSREHYYRRLMELFQRNCHGGEGINR